jgi:hypothetical protein
VDTAGCNAWDLSGPEQVFRIPAGPALTAQATLAVKSADLRLVVYAVSDPPLGCSEEICITAGENSVQWDTTPGTEYLLHVDGHQGNAGAFALQFECHASTEVVCNNGVDEDADSLLDCQDPDCAESPLCTGCVGIAPLGCGTTLSANTESPLATDNLNEYACTPDALDGPELAYVIPANDQPITYTATLASQTGGHRLNRIEAGESGTCVASDCVDSANTLEWTSIPGEASFLVVDSTADFAGGFALQLGCEAGTEFDCANGVDEDGNGLIDCDDPACGSEQGCGLCHPLWPLSCNSAFEFSTLSPLATTTAILSGCEGQDPTPGAEVAFSFLSATPQYVKAHLATNEPGARIAWIAAGTDGSCHPDACLDDGPDLAEIMAEPNQLYHLLVDSTTAGTMDFFVSLECGVDTEMACANGVDEDLDGLLDCLDPDCDGSAECMDCLPIQTLNCDTTHASPLAEEFFTEAFASFACGDTPSNGLEATWRVAPPEGTAMEITLANAPAESQAYLVGENLLGGCDGAVCLGSDDTTLTFAPTAEQPTAMFVVDLPAGTSSPFLVGATCTPLVETECDNGEDEDADGDVDCEDSDCLSAPACFSNPETDCHNSLDDDLDGDTDCADEDCVDALPCGVCQSTAILLCDQPVMGMTNGATSNSNIDANPCALNTPAPGAETSVRVGSNLTGPTPVQILADPGVLVTLIEEPGGGCHVGQCIASSENGDMEWVLQPTSGTYYLIFDSSPAGAPGMFDVMLDCP